MTWRLGCALSQSGKYGEIKILDPTGMLLHPTHSYHGSARMHRLYSYLKFVPLFSPFW
jgi:hypothetical protein